MDFAFLKTKLSNLRRSRTSERRVHIICNFEADLQNLSIAPSSDTLQ